MAEVLDGPDKVTFLLGPFTLRSAGHYFCGFQRDAEREGGEGGGDASGISFCVLVILFLLVSFNETFHKQ